MVVSKIRFQNHLNISIKTVFQYSIQYFIQAQHYHDYDSYIKAVAIVPAPSTIDSLLLVHLCRNNNTVSIVLTTESLHIRITYNLNLSLILCFNFLSHSHYPKVYKQTKTHKKNLRKYIHSREKQKDIYYQQDSNVRHHDLKSSVLSTAPQRLALDSLF